MIVYLSCSNRSYIIAGGDVINCTTNKSSVILKRNYLFALTYERCYNLHFHFYEKKNAWGKYFPTIQP